MILTSGNANAATGEPGRSAAERLCVAVAGEIGSTAEEILVCQTGLIGIPFPVEHVLPQLEPIVMARGGTERDAAHAARAIMTTDTVPKEVVVAGDGFTVGGMAKGAAMLAPNMATMLALCTTDAAVDAATLQQALGEAVAASFNAITVDGCTSTNDTVLVLASGLGSSPSPAALTRALTEACRSSPSRWWTTQRARPRCPTCTSAVRRPTTPPTGRRARSRTPCSSSAPSSERTPTGGASCPSSARPGRPSTSIACTVAYGGTVVCAAGVAVPHDEAAVAAHMAGRHIVLDCDLGLGSGEAVVLGTDLSYGYIDENRTTS